MRLDKYLADAGMGTRSEIKTKIRKKAVTVNGTLITDPGTAVEQNDIICVAGKQIRLSTNRYFMFHKPGDCVSATVDSGRTVLDYFTNENVKKLFPVGRLDKDTEGLLLITDDGAFAHNLTSPKKHMNKCYYFEGQGMLCENAQQLVAMGLDIGDEKLTMPAILEIIEENKEKKYMNGLLTIQEGRYHQVKRMLHVLGVEITYLRRDSIGTVELDPSLKKGEYRPLTDTELEQLKKNYTLK